jgi:branched-chain amino acid transport system ATP-binding protein
MTLVVEGLEARYGQFLALSGVDLAVGEGDVLAVIGANGAGKSTLLGAVAGTVPATGRVELDGEPLGALPAHRRARRGVATVPEGRRLFPSLSVRENLLMGVVRGRAGRWTLDAVHELFPFVAELGDRPAGLLSGGEQQAVAIGRALLSGPRVLLLDEVSLGLAPAVVDRLYAALAEVRATGLAMVVVEQDVGRALTLADRVLCLRSGRPVLAAPADGLTAADVTAAYFGAAS